MNSSTKKQNKNKKKNEEKRSDINFFFSEIWQFLPLKTLKKQLIITTLYS